MFQIFVYIYYSDQNGYGEVSKLRSVVIDDFYSPILSSAQVLPANQMLILDGNDGRMIKVDDNDNIIWEYINPVNRNGGPGIQGGTPRFNSLFEVRSYTSTYRGLEGRNLDGDKPIELLPIENNCDNTTSIDITAGINPVCYFNSARNVIYIENADSNTALAIFSMSGSKCFESVLTKGINEINLEHLNSGLYVYRFLTKSEVYYKH